MSRRKDKLFKEILKIEIQWDGPFKPKTVIEKNNDSGRRPYYEGRDYGLYQIYGNHILCGTDTLLYIGEATDQTFSVRFSQHQKEWLEREKGAQIYLGRIYDPKRHYRKDKWNSWREDVKIAERILIYKYSPHYNNVGISDFPKLSNSAQLIHSGKRHRLKKKDNAPEDF